MKTLINGRLIIPDANGDFKICAASVTLDPADALNRCDIGKVYAAPERNAAHC